MHAWRVGDFVCMNRTFGYQDVKSFSELVGDYNPVHLSDEYAATTVFKKPIVHGMLVTSLFSAILAEKLPGKGTIYLGQEVKFYLPIYIGEKITAKVTIREISKSKPIMILDTEIINSDRQIAVEGKATVKFLI